MSIEILAGIFILFSMAALGAPVAYAILSGIIVYLGYPTVGCSVILWGPIGRQAGRWVQ